MVSKLSSGDAQRLWKQVGLEKLNGTLARVRELTGKFETALGSLPSCNQCARLALIEQIQDGGLSLSGEVLTLSTLAGSLRQALAEAEKNISDLKDNPPPPCQCSGPACSCHH